MFKLRVEVNLLEVLRTSDDVELAFKRRGYKLNIASSKNGYCINASIHNEEGEKITYEFMARTAEKCYLEAAVFLKQVQRIRAEVGLEVY